MLNVSPLGVVKVLPVRDHVPDDDVAAKDIIDIGSIDRMKIIRIAGGSSHFL